MGLRRHALHNRPVKAGESFGVGLSGKLTLGDGTVEACLDGLEPGLPPLGDRLPGKSIRRVSTNCCAPIDTICCFIFIASRSTMASAWAGTLHCSTSTTGPRWARCIDPGIKHPEVQNLRRRRSARQVRPRRFPAGVSSSRLSYLACQQDTPMTKAFGRSNSGRASSPDVLPHMSPAARTVSSPLMNASRGIPGPRSVSRTVRVRSVRLATTTQMRPCTSRAAIHAIADICETPLSRPRT
ncbi:hypothetical protein HDG42_001042 [Paraburkholderia sp. JPY171]|nr:hypothetical protein [Paraburkholderia atlantica]